MFKTVWLALYSVVRLACKRYKIKNTRFDHFILIRFVWRSGFPLPRNYLSRHCRWSLFSQDFVFFSGILFNLTCLTIGGLSVVPKKKILSAWSFHWVHFVRLCGRHLGNAHNAYETSASGYSNHKKAPVKIFWFSSWSPKRLFQRRFEHSPNGDRIAEQNTLNESSIRPIFFWYYS